MPETIKTGLCVFALLLALLAAYVQEVSFQQGGPAGALVQTGPFTAVQVK